VHHEHEPAVVRREQEALGTPVDAKRAAVECPQRRVDRLQRRDVRGAGVLDRRRGDERVELTAPCLDFG
jgi:hypothetical protein